MSSSCKLREKKQVIIWQGGRKRKVGQRGNKERRVDSWKGKWENTGHRGGEEVSGAKGKKAP